MSDWRQMAVLFTRIAGTTGVFAGFVGIGRNVPVVRLPSARAVSEQVRGFRQRLSAGWRCEYDGITSHVNVSTLLNRFINLRIDAMLRDLICYFVDRLPRSGRTQVVKYLYLADLESRRHQGKPLTDLRWIRHNHGPFDKRILDALDELSSHGSLIEEQVTFPNGYQGSFYNTVRTPRVSFDDTTQAILDIVVKQYGNMPLRELLDDVVYETEPVKSADDRMPLDMARVDHAAAIPGVPLEDAWKGFRDMQEGRTIPFEEAFRRARTG